jgi:hypothetical protein
MAEVPGGATELLVCGYKGKKADQLVTRIDLGVVSLVAGPRGHERPGRRGIGAVEGWCRGAQAPRRRRSRWLRAMVGLPKYSPPMPWPPTGDRGWKARSAGVGSIACAPTLT